MTNDTTPKMTGQQRVAKANAVRMRRAEEKMADRLRERGWTCTPPADTDS